MRTIAFINEWIWSWKYYIHIQFHFILLGPIYFPTLPRILHFRIYQDYGKQQ